VVATAILTVPAALHLHHHRAGAPDNPAAASQDAAPPGDSARAAPSGVAPGPLRLDGRVVDGHHQPIGDATIALNGARTTTSTADGGFAFEGLAPGEYMVTAERDVAYGEWRTTLSDSSEPMEIRMYIGPTVALHVVDRAGVPVVGAKVMALGNVDAFTDQTGTVRRRCEPGRALFEVQAPGYASRWVRDVLGEDPREIVDRTIVLGPTAPIGGIVIDEDGAPVADAQVEVEQVDDSWSDVTRTDDQGRWRLDSFGAGTLRLKARVGIGSAPAQPLVEFDARAPRFGLVLTADRGATLDCVVVDAAGHPVSGASLTAQDRTQSGFISGGGTDDQGRLSFSGLDEAELIVTAKSTERVSPPRIVHVPRHGHVEVRLPLLASGIAGTVTDPFGQPVADATVSAHPGYASASTDAAGHFVILDAEPGDHALSATRESAPDHWLGLAEHHTVPAHPGDQHVALVLPDVGRITGRVVLDGRPVPFFGVALGPLGPEPRYAPDGRFELEVQTVTELPEARTIALVGPGFERLVLDRVLAIPGKTTNLGDIAVSAGKSLRGRVVTASGAPVVGATVVVHIGDGLDTEVTLNAENEDRRGARSDASGRFEIAGLPDDIAGLTIGAQHPDIGQAPPRALTAADLAGDVEIALAPTGAVLGTVIGDLPGEPRDRGRVARRWPAGVGEHLGRRVLDPAAPGR
jgi:hypothetical protein